MAEAAQFPGLTATEAAEAAAVTAIGWVTQWAEEEEAVSTVAEVEVV